MIISINNAVTSTNIFIAIFLIAILVTMRSSKNKEVFSNTHTQELKGFAILAILFSHIGLFLVSDQRFLFPLSIMAGVGVNLFLFLSGFGLTMSTLKNNASVWRKQGKRILNMLIPFWITLAVFFLLDYFALNLSYDPLYIIRSFLGWFPSADLFKDINSPLWYFSLIIFYYLLFPIVFLRKIPWLSAILIFMITYAIVKIDPVLTSDVMRLYQVHILAFPLGIFIGSVFFFPNKFNNYLKYRYQRFIELLKLKVQEIKISGDYQNENIWKMIVFVANLILISSLLFIISYSAYHSGVNISPSIEQFISTGTALSLLLLILIKKINLKLFYYFGFYSYEIYLLHWPILSRYDWFFAHLPAYLALSLYLLIFLGLGYLLKKITKQVACLILR